MDLSEKLQARLAEAPDSPGCYIMRNRSGKIIYIGKAASIRKRVQSYFRADIQRRGDPKTRGLVRSVDDIEFRCTKTEAEAILTETRLIQTYKPQFNIRAKDDKHFMLIRLNRRVPWPRLELCRLRTDPDSQYFGPYPSSASVRVLRDFTEKRYGLIRCSPRVPDESTHAHCINDIVRYCSAPCVGRIQSAEYEARLDEAGAFLSGQRPEVLRELRKEMETAAEARQFERAATIRDTFFLLERSLKRGIGVGDRERRRREDGSAGVLELMRALQLSKPPRLIEGYDISNISGTFAVASQVVCFDGRPDRSRYRRFRIKTVHQADDPAMMAETLSRRFRDVKNDGGGPDLVMVDGGLTQLLAARRTLDRLGLTSIRIIGLAKRFEEIYRDDAAAPLRLPPESHALKLLQRLRDEAHRFALDYHRHLRSRRIRESALDAVPGIGPKRKEVLLKIFGSVRRLARASEADIAKVPGMGYETAAAIKEALKSLAGTPPL